MQKSNWKVFVTKAFRSVLVTIISFFLLLTGGWYYVKTEFETQIKHAVFNLNQAGHKAKYDSLSIGGYPFNIKGNLKKVSFQQAPQRNNSVIDLSAATVEFNCSLFTPLTPKFIVNSQKAILSDNSGKEISLSAPKMDGIVHLTTGGKIKEGEIRAVYPSLTAQDGSITSAREFKFEVRHVRDEANKKQRNLSLVGSLKNVQLSVASPFNENKILMIYLDSILSNTETLPLTKQDLASWRDSQGIMQVRTLSLKSPNISAHAAGNIQLDAQLRPEGKLSIKTPVLNELISVFSFYGTLSSDAEKTLKFMQGFNMAIPQSKDSNLSLSLKAKNGKLSMGGIPISTLKPLA